MSFRIGKCRVSVSFYFFALLCAASFFDRTGNLPWGLLAASLHEAGHLAAMFFIPGNAPEEVSVTPFGMRIERNPLSEFGRGNAFVLAAGSGMNFLCAAVTFGFLPQFASVSLVLGVLNVLPVEGMDGGGILRIVLEQTFAPGKAGFLLKIVSYATLAAMLLTGILVLAATGYNVTLIGVTLLLALKGPGKRDPDFRSGT